MPGLKEYPKRSPGICYFHLISSTVAGCSNLYYFTLKLIPFSVCQPVLSVNLTIMW